MASSNPALCDSFPARTSDDLEDDDERRIWEHAMKDFRLGGKSPREAAVLMISWAKELDDLDTEEEVNGLEAVFTDLFNYTVIKRQISGDRRPAIQLALYLAEFVHTYDNESTLLIVYYAGHGVPKVLGGLHFAGNRQPDQKLSNQNAAAWHDVEHIIRDAEGDALLIFDCCYAGNLTLRDVRSSRPTRSFEYIAACKSTDETSFPGPESFTSALIWALEDLVKSQKRFSTSELQTKIMTEAPSFPRKQSVLVMERDDSCDQRLVLAPLPSATSGISTTLSQGFDELPQNHVDLRFWYPNRPDRKEVENLANRLKRLMKDQNIDACCVSWLGLRSRGVVNHINGDAGPQNGHLAFHQSCFDPSQSNSPHDQASTYHSARREKRNIAEDRSLTKSFGFMRRISPDMIWRIIGPSNLGFWPIPVFGEEASLVEQRFLDFKPIYVGLGQTDICGSPMASWEEGASVVRPRRSFRS